MERESISMTRVRKRALEGGQENEAEAGGACGVKGRLSEVWETFPNIWCMLMVTVQEGAGSWGEAAPGQEGGR